MLELAPMADHAMESNRGTTAMLALLPHRAGNLACLARDLYVFLDGSMGNPSVEIELPLA
jgi:hypothetical protein